MEYVNAGHEPPFVIRMNGDILRLSEGGILLGVLPTASYARGSVELEQDDVVVLFTDGVTEAMGLREEQYTEARLQERASALRYRSAQEILARIQADIEEFTGPVNVLSDDRTMIVLKVSFAGGAADIVGSEP